MLRDDFLQPVTKRNIRFSFKNKQDQHSIKKWFFDSWKTRLGYVQACATEDALFALQWTGSAAPMKPEERAGLTPLGQHQPSMLKRYKQHLFENSSQTINIDLYGTDFQCTVWRLLLNLDDQDTINYSELARLAGRHKAQRAVGSAVGANPMFLLIPCHRVIRRDGSLGGYAYGLDLKQKILAMEKDKEPIFKQ